MAYYLYVSSQEDDKISIFSMDGASGKLDSRGEEKVSGGPAPLAADPQRNFLYVARRGEKEISSFRIDQENAGLSPIGTVSYSV